MQIQHDKHQYYFEKFLRNEMKEEELAAFRLRLLEDEAFRTDFDYYTANRKSILDEELLEYDEPEILLRKPQKWGWVYAILSVLCLVLIVDYFLTARYSESVQAEKKRKPFIERFNVFKTKEVDNLVIEKPEEKPKTKQKLELVETDTMVGSGIFDKEIEPYLESDRMGVKGDYFVSDSLFYVFEKADITKKVEELKTQTENIWGDSALELMLLKSAFKTLGLPKRQLLVEFWDSPLHFRGYLFNGKKLVLYDLEYADELVLVFDEQAKVYHLYFGDHEYHLFADEHIHQLAE
ncbi:MAG: hypothetical protein FGM41_11230 [Bacteroidetes bacterium]|nr:hypothetical protein [Bacteroidota bacterium]